MYIQFNMIAMEYKLQYILLYASLNQLQLPLTSTYKTVTDRQTDRAGLMYQVPVYAA